MDMPSMEFAEDKPEPKKEPQPLQVQKTPSKIQEDLKMQENAEEVKEIQSKEPKEMPLPEKKAPKSPKVDGNGSTKATTPKAAGNKPVENPLSMNEIEIPDKASEIIKAKRPEAEKMVMWTLPPC